MMGRVIPAGIPGGGIASPQADAIQRGLLCLREMAPAIWGMTQHQYPGDCSLSSLSRATKPRISSSIASPLCTPFTTTQDEWAIEILFFGL